MALCSAYGADGEVGIQVSVSVALATALGLAVRIITAGPVVSLVLLLLFMDSDDVCLAWLYTDLLDFERCVPLEDC